MVQSTLAAQSPFTLLTSLSLLTLFCNIDLGFHSLCRLVYVSLSARVGSWQLSGIVHWIHLHLSVVSEPRPIRLRRCNIRRSIHLPSSTDRHSHSRIHKARSPSRYLHLIHSLSLTKIVARRRSGKVLSRFRPSTPRIWWQGRRAGRK